MAIKRVHQSDDVLSRIERSSCLHCMHACVMTKKSEYKLKQTLAKATKDVRDKFSQIRSSRIEDSRLLEEQYKPITSRLSKLINASSVAAPAAASERKKTKELRIVQPIDRPTPFRKKNRKRARVITGTTIHRPKKTLKTDNVSKASRKISFGSNKQQSAEKAMQKKIQSLNEMSGAYDAGASAASARQSLQLNSDTESISSEGRTGALNRRSKIHRRQLHDESRELDQMRARLDSNAVQDTRYNSVSSRLRPRKESAKPSDEPRDYYQSDDDESDNTGAGLFDLSWKHVYKKKNETLYESHTYWNDPNELVDRLRLLVASASAGHSGHHNEILSIIEELREADIIE